MRDAESHSGDKGWLLLTAGVVAWDVFAPETLSNAVDRYMEHPLGRVAVLGAVCVVGAHLLNLLPDQADPVNLLGDAMGWVYDQTKQARVGD